MFGIIVCAHTLYAQPAFTANDIVPPYEAPFGYGTNVGAYPPWRDENLANIAKGNKELDLEGIGVTCFRPELPELFVEFWGYDIRVDAFRHYDSLGMNDHVLFIGQPSPQHRDSTFYCPTERSKLFKNLYSPIWDSGENNTPVNDTNYFARYVYWLAYYYGDYVKFWEVWNEPDLDLSGHAPLHPGQPGNWWENDPGPCETQIFAPIFHYIRMLRITYEVIKSIHPEDYIAVGGLGNMSYLDAILRNSDNPNKGRVTPDFPKKGGAYFDCMSFHSYPHLDGSLRYWSDDLMDFVPTRHSDKAVEGMVKRRDAMETVLFDHGYNGRKYPEKVWILTESNIPRKAFTPGFIGSDHAQRNYIVKALIASQMHNIHQFHTYSLADVEPEDSASYEFEVMGLVKNLTGTSPHGYEMNEVGIAYHTCSQLLLGWEYDSVETKKLELPQGIRGAAFKKGDSLTYALWVVTEIDNSEFAYAKYTFPEELNIKRLERFWWTYADTKWSDFIAPKEVELNGDPTFFRPEFTSAVRKKEQNAFSFLIEPNPAQTTAHLEISLKKPAVLSVELRALDGRLLSQVIDHQFFTDGSHHISAPVSHLPQGIYLLKISDGTSVRVERLAIVR